MATKRYILSLLAATAVLALALPAAAEYPERPITMLVGFPAGGSTDQTARLLATFLPAELGGTPGSSCETRPAPEVRSASRARERAARRLHDRLRQHAQPDHDPDRAATRYKWQDFDLIGNIVDDPGNFAVHGDSPIRTLAELAAHAKANPGKVTVGTTGTGSDDHLAMLMFERIAGVKMLHVPFKGAAEVRTNLAGRQIKSVRSISARRYRRSRAAPRFATSVR